MPTGLTAPLTGATFSTMTIDELCDADLLLVQEMDDVGTHLLAELLGMNVGYVEGRPHRSTGRRRWSR